jgi:uncharacterized protein (DUF362 family)
MALRTRRQFLAEAAAGLSAAAAAGCFPEVGGEWARERAVCAGDPPVAPTDPAPVVEARSDAAVLEDPATGRWTVDPAVVRTMLDAVVAGLAAGAAQPWPALLPDATPATRVGIKVNALNPGCATSPALVRALAESLQAGLGIPPSQILVWDRRDDELQRAGITAEAVGVPVVSTLGSSAAPGPGYEGDYCLANGKRTQLARLLTERTDLTINCPVLKTHEVSGVTAGMKNVYGAIHNPQEFHADLATALPAIYALAPVRQRIRLTLCDALVAVTVGGTSWPPDAVPKRIFGSRDPLAADARALALVNELRAARAPAFPAVDPAAVAWLGHAQDLGLGTVDYRLATV